jgi:hypothetical protein
MPERALALKEGFPMSKPKSAATSNAENTKDGEMPQPVLSQDARRKAKTLSKHAERETALARKRAAKARV